MDNVEVNRLMPKNAISATTSPRTIGELYTKHVTFVENPEAVRTAYPWADRFVCGMPLAPWQRPVVWDADMQMQFVDALWAHVDTGSYMVNAWWEMLNDSGEMVYLSDIVIDGQQRLTSLENYFLDKIPATAADGSKLFWSEITRLDQMSFQNKVFPRTEISTNDETELRKAYDIRAFSGVRHTEDQRAMPVKLPQ